MSDTVIRVENVSKLYRLGEVGTGSLAHDVNRWWHKVRGKEDPYLKIGEVNDRTKPVSSGSKNRKLTTEDTEGTERGASGNQRADSAEFLEGHSQAGLQMDSEKLASISSANYSRASGEQTGSDSESVLIRDIRGKKTENFNLKTENSAPPASDWVYALKDVSFDVKRGEVLGIIGRNGAGKSTLLKILSRVTTQSSGQIKVKGRIASLLEVGTGFHPELTGRENIFLNGAILGMRKAEIARKFDEIVEFSGCARYIDTPVKRYSSGMYVRLAFAVAAHLEPEILIVDEVLAVGDAEFQKKCLGKMKDVAGEGRTVLFVTHQLSFITSISKNCIWMDSGTVKAQGPTIPIVQEYINAGNIGRSFERERLPDSKATLTKGSYFAENNIGLTRMMFSFEIDAAELVSASLDFRIKDAMLREVGFGSLGVFDAKELLDIAPGKNQIQVALDTGNLASGIYTLSVDLSIPEKAYFDRVENGMTFEVARPNTAGHSRILQQAWGYGCWHVHLEKVAL